MPRYIPCDATSSRDQRVTNRRIPAGRVSPEDFERIHAVLAAAPRVGAQR